MKCPHCTTSAHFDWEEIIFPASSDDACYTKGYAISYGFCPECHQLVISLKSGSIKYRGNIPYMDSRIDIIDINNIIYPHSKTGRKLNEHIPTQYAQLFHESEEVNNISPRASATLSRYLLQMLLHEELDIKKKNLEEEIMALEDDRSVPTNLITMLQVMRKVANFGAHPKKSTNSNEIVEVETGESEVMLDLLEELFDYIFVKPKQRKLFLENINKKYGINTDE